MILLRQRAYSNGDKKEKPRRKLSREDKIGAGVSTGVGAAGAITAHILEEVGRRKADNAYNEAHVGLLKTKYKGLRKVAKEKEAALEKAMESSAKGSENIGEAYLKFRKKASAIKKAAREAEGKVIKDYSKDAEAILDKSINSVKKVEKRSNKIRLATAIAAPTIGFAAYQIAKKKKDNKNK